MLYQISFSWILNIIFFLQDNEASPFKQNFQFNILVHLVRTNMTMYFGSKKIWLKNFGAKNFGQEKFWSNKILAKKNYGLENFRSNNFLGPKDFGPKRSLIHKNVCQKFLVLKLGQ